MTTPTEAEREAAADITKRLADAVYLGGRANCEWLTETIAAALAQQREAVWDEAIEALNNIFLPAVASASYTYTREGIQMAIEQLAHARKGGAEE